jgi:hypothetical protein
MGHTHPLFHAPDLTPTAQTAEVELFSRSAFFDLNRKVNSGI